MPLHVACFHMALYCFMTLCFDHSDASVLRHSDMIENKIDKGKYKFLKQWCFYARIFYTLTDM